MASLALKSPAPGLKTDAETTNEAYSGAAQAVLVKATGAFVKLFAANSAK
jgi:hypothetical protein